MKRSVFHSAVKTLFYALLSVLLLPWCCQSLLAKAVSSKSRLCLSEVESVEVSSTDSFDDDKLDRMKQKQKRELPQPRKQQLFLFSLNWVQENDPEYFLKKDVRSLWEWKDVVLGDGRDFFVPKTKTLMALQHYLLENIYNLTECSIISNCARLEVLCCCSYIPQLDHCDREETRQLKELQELLLRSISDCFVVQFNHNRNLSTNDDVWTKLMLTLEVNADRPAYSLTREPPRISCYQSHSYYDSWWDIYVGPEAILPRICKISAGMCSRPRRPDRPVVFRPYSSRDAHILLQLKRTRENIGFSSIGGEKTIVKKSRTVCKNQRRKEFPTEERKLLPMILDYAIRSGKASRNSAIVPEILALKQMTSAENSVTNTLDKKNSERVAEAAYEKGIQPLIMECLIKLDESANKIDRKITKFRQCALELLLQIDAVDKAIDCNAAIDNEKNAQELRSWLNRRLHEPTMKLRSLSRRQDNRNNSEGDGNTEDIDLYIINTLKEINGELRNTCRQDLNRPENIEFINRI